MTLLRKTAAMLAAFSVVFATGRLLLAQEAPFTTASRLWVDDKTGQVFVRPGPGRSLLKLEPAPDEKTIEQHVEQHTQEQVQSAIAQSQAQQQLRQTNLERQVAAIQPAWKSYVDNFQNKLRIGALAYLDYSFYSHTGFGPQFLENLNPPGPGNNGYNSFDINRVYLNTYFTPTNDLTFRFTPELYRANGGSGCVTSSASSCSINDKQGTTTGVGSNLDGDMNLRMKYAFLQYSALWDRVPFLKGGNMTVGAQPNPLLGWEEDFSQYRFVYLSPWNYLGLSSSQIGLQFAGPVHFAGEEKTYFDYAAGVYDNGNFRTQEQTNTKQVMGRGTVYPFGAAYRFQGLGLTGFWNYGWGNTTPDNEGLSTPLKGSRAQFERIAAILSYAAEQWNVLGEFDYGKNAFQLGNLFSGSGPSDAFGTPSGAAITNDGAPARGFGNTCSKSTGVPPANVPCYNIFDTYGPQTSVYQAILNNGRTRQVGLDFLGHYHIPGTKFTAFGMFQWLMPNDYLSGSDPLDFQRFVAGVSYQYNEFLRVALDSQNLLFYHKQFGWGIPTADKYNYAPGSKFNGWQLPKTIPGSLGGQIPDLAPRDTHAIFLNMEFAY